MTQPGLKKSLEEAAARLLVAASEDPGRAAKLRTMAAQLQALCLEIEDYEAAQKRDDVADKRA